jgi:hypothetical protein
MTNLREVIYNYMRMSSMGKLCAQPLIAFIAYIYKIEKVFLTLLHTILRVGSWHYILKIFVLMGNILLL